MLAAEGIYTIPGHLITVLRRNSTHGLAQTINDPVNRRTKPVLWETLVFNDYDDGDMLRYTSKEDAIAGHQRTVAEQEARLGLRATT